MPKLTVLFVLPKDWFDNCGVWKPCHSFEILAKGISAGFLNRPDDYSLTALYSAVTSKWRDGITQLLRAGADTEVREYLHGTTALYEAVLEKDRTIATALIEGGANPDAANYWGITPRKWQPTWFEHIPQRLPELPEPRIQNAEHLADHYHPKFEIPDLKERVSLKIGQAVNLYVYGPKSESKQDTVKVRILRREGSGPNVLYTAIIETPIERTHLRAGTTHLEFGPENVATVYIV